VELFLRISKFSKFLGTLSSNVKVEQVISQKENNSFYGIFPNDFRTISLNSIVLRYKTARDERIVQIFEFELQEIYESAPHPIAFAQVISL